MDRGFAGGKYADLRCFIAEFRHDLWAARFSSNICPVKHLINMKTAEKKSATNLRTEGWSIKQIANHLNVSKGSVSYWIRDVILSDEAKRKLAKRKILGYEKQRLSRLKNSEIKLNTLLKECQHIVGPISKRDLFIAGLMLYAGEGTKRRSPQSQRVELTNADPVLARVFVEFLMLCCDVPKGIIHPRLFLYKDMNEDVLIKKWVDFLSIPRCQFSRSQFKIRSEGTPGRKSEYGTIHIEVFKKKLFQQMMGWISAFYENTSGCGLIG